MYENSEDFRGYGEADLAIRSAGANSHQLVLMLFGGLMDELVRAKGHVEAHRLERKTTSISKCIDILNALTSVLNYQQGGELANRLASLYDYCVYRLYDASNTMSINRIEEVQHIVSELHLGWQEMKS